ncbi:MAG: Na+/H+ antiporter NhaC family protein [Eubacteriales bacterium]|nr:Na+/H+ antiporter NhaC family protein [Eubacteriales bacterium]
MADNIKEEKLEFRGGMFGLLVPFIIMLGGILILSVGGRALPMAFWVPALAGIFSALVLAKDRAKCADALIAGIANPTVIMIVVVLFFAGIVANIMKTTGLVEGLTWLCSRIGVSGALFPLITFLCGSLLSTATGTALGTVMSLAPVLYPVGVALGAYPPLMLGAIVSAAYFGDNIAPVSDTTIASAYTQDVAVPVVVRSRLKYAFAGAAIAAVLFVVTGFLFYSGPSGGTAVVETSPNGLIMLAVPALLIFMMVRGNHMLSALTTASVVGLVIGIVSGQLNIADVLVINMDSFTVSGTLVDGINGMMDTVVFAMLLMALVHLLEVGGVFQVLLDKVSGFTDTPKKAELVIAAADIILNILTVCNSVVILMEGPLARHLLTEKHGITPDRSANILDAVSCVAMCLIPYGFAPMLAYTFAAGSGAPVNFSMNMVVLFSFHGIGLGIVMLFSILSGWGRTFVDKEKRS